MSRTDDHDWSAIIADDQTTTEGYDGPDPHGIVPDSFKFQSIHDAARQANRADDIREDPRCTECLSPNIGRKPGGTADAPSHQIDAAYRCRSCGTHFDEPACPAIEMPTCGGCGRQLHVRALGGGRFRCGSCERDWQTLGGME